MEKIIINNLLIKEDNKWTLEKISNYSLQEIKNKYFNKIVTDGIDDLHVTKIHFTPTGLSKEDYIVDLIDDDYEASQFLKL